jgi:hypothetical protein
LKSRPVTKTNAIFGICIYFRIQRNGKHLNHKKSFNWTVEGGYPDSQTKETFPHRALDSGAGSGLTITIHMANRDIAPLCSRSIHGVKVSIILDNHNCTPDVSV